MDEDFNREHPYDIQVEDEDNEPTTQIPQIENDETTQIENDVEQYQGVEVTGVTPEVGELTRMAPENSEDEVQIEEEEEDKNE